MGVKTLVSVLAVASYCQGAAIFSENDEWFNAIQNFLDDPETTVAALGATRVKTDADYDQEYTMAALGVSVGLKYTDASNPIKGGKAYARFPLKRFLPQAQSETVDLKMSFDGGNAVDGLFTMSVDYVLKHSDGHGEEKGTFTVSRKNVDGKWKTDISTSGEAFPHRLIPLFSVSAESDRKTQMSVTFNREYTLAITLNKAAMSADIIVNAAGKDYKLTGKVSNDDSWKITVTGDVAGAVDATILIKKDYKEAKIDVSYNNAKIVQMKLKGTHNPDGSCKSKAKFSLLGGKVASGEFDVSYADNKFNVVIRPNNHPELDLTFDMKHSDAGSAYSGVVFEAKRGGESMLKYDGDYKHKIDATKYAGTLKTEMQLSEKSLMYPIVCKIGELVGTGCFKNRQMEVKVILDKVAKNKLFNKFSFGLKNIKDGETKLDVSISTLQNPYQLKIVSPRLQSKIGSNQITITADHNPGQELTVKSSFQNFKFFLKHGETKNGRKYLAEISKAGESFLKYEFNFNFEKDASAINLGLFSQFDVNENSLFYPIFCSYGSGCFKQRKADISIFVDLVNKNVLINKFDVHANLLKDDEKVFELEACTKHTPYKFNIKAPHILPNLIGQPSVEVEALHQLGQSLEITTNFVKAKSFSIQKTSGNMREVKFNGKLLFKGDMTIENKVFIQQLELVNGKTRTLTVSLENDALDVSAIRANEVKINLAGGKLNFDVELEWDMTTPTDAVFEIEAKGTGILLGQFELKREVDWKFTGNKLIASVIGKSSSEKGLFAENGLSLIDTKANVNFDYINMNLNANMVKVIAGKRYAIGVKDNKPYYKF